MFEIGKWYVIYTVENGGETSGTYRVDEFQFPLVKLYNPYSEDLILNTASPIFARAELSKHQRELAKDSATEDEKDFA